jgi:hypothetical protein
MTEKHTMIQLKIVEVTAKNRKLKMEEIMITSSIKLGKFEEQISISLREYFRLKSNIQNWSEIS